MPKPVDTEPLVPPSAVTRGAAAAREAIAAGAQPNTLDEPAIGEKGEKPAKTVTIELGQPGQPVATLVEEEAAQAAASAGVEGEEGEEGTGEQAPDEPFVVALPELRQGQEPIELECEDQEVADAINSLVKGNARRDQFNAAMKDIN